MNFPVRRNRAGAFSAFELVVVVAVVAILAAMLLPALARAKSKAQEINCRNNLKQVGLGFRIFAVDNNDKFPMAVSTNEGGSREFVATGSAFRHFRSLSNELVTPKVLYCPAEVMKSAAASFTQLDNAHLSYFVGLDAVEDQPLFWLSGDGNLSGGDAGSGGVMVIKPESPVQWVDARHAGGGNIGFADGSVLSFGADRLPEALRQSEQTNRLALP